MWKTVLIHNTQIVGKMERAVLISMPKGSNYKGYNFWHPLKLVRKKGGMFTFSYTDEFKFHIIKNGNGKYTKFDIIDEMDIDVEAMEKAFSNQRCS